MYIDSICLDFLATCTCPNFANFHDMPQYQRPLASINSSKCLIYTLAFNTF